MADKLSISQTQMIVGSGASTIICQITAKEVKNFRSKELVVCSLMSNAAKSMAGIGIGGNDQANRGMVFDSNGTSGT